MNSHLVVTRIARWAVLLVVAAGVGACKKATGQTCHYDPSEVPDNLTSVFCPEGQQCAAHQAVCITGLCGNGQRDPGEDCDDGNLKNGDGCKGDCTSDETCNNGHWDSYYPVLEQCDATAPGSPPCDDKCNRVVAGCGNQILDEHEQCDLGSDENGVSKNTSGSLCTPECQVNRCGDGYRYSGTNPEECESGDVGKKYDVSQVHDTCDYGFHSCSLCSVCHWVQGKTSYCGDGHTDADHEKCDSGVTVDPTECPYGQATCTLCSAHCSWLPQLKGAYCGDGTVQQDHGENCDDLRSFACGTCRGPGEAGACTMANPLQQSARGWVHVEHADQLLDVSFTLSSGFLSPKDFVFRYVWGDANNPVSQVSDGYNIAVAARNGGTATEQDVAERTRDAINRLSSFSAVVEEPSSSNTSTGTHVHVTINPKGALGNIDIKLSAKRGLRVEGMSGGRGCVAGELCSVDQDCISSSCNAWGVCD